MNRQGGITSEWKFRIAVEPATEPITLSEAKNYLKVDVSTDDDLITAQVKAARQHIEGDAALAIITQTIAQVWDEFPPAGGALYLARSPLRAVSSVYYRDTAGDVQTLSASTYFVDDYDIPARLVLKYNQTWPETYQEPNAITALFTAGWTDADAVPEDLKISLRLILADMYQNRTDYVKRMPTAAEYLLQKYRVKLF